MSALSLVRRLLRLATRSQPRSMFPGRRPGRPVRAVIAPAAWGGYMLFVEYRITERVDLPIRFEEYDAPDELEFAAAAEALRVRGLTLAAGWLPESSGSVGLTAPLCVAPLEVTG